MQLASHAMEKKAVITSTAAGLASTCVLVPHGGGPVIISAPDWSGSKAMTLYGGSDPKDADSFKPLLKDDGEVDSYTLDGCRMLNIGGLYITFSLANPGTGATLTFPQPYKTFAP